MDWVYIYISLPVSTCIDKILFAKQVFEIWYCNIISSHCDFCNINWAVDN